MEPFKCIKQLILHSGIYVLLFFHIRMTNTRLIHEHVMLENTFLGQSNKAIVSPFIKTPGGEE